MPRKPSDGAVRGAANRSKRRSRARTAGRARTKGLTASADSDAMRQSLAATIENDMPDWELVPRQADADSLTEEQDMADQADQGPSIAELKRKFLGEDAADDAEEEFSTDDRKPVRIRPKKGGAAKTADVGPDGKVTIVQG